MKPALRASVTLPLAALLATPHSAAADPFPIVGQSRSVDARLFVGNYLAEPPTLLSLDLGAWEAGWSLGPRTWGTPDDATATGAIAVAQQSFIGTSQLSFSGSADAFATGYRTTQFGDYHAIAHGNTAYDVAFDIATPIQVKLTLDSEIGGQGSIESIFDFELLRDGAVVWTDELKRDPVTGAETRSFTQTLLLQPGHYALSAVVRASAAVYPDASLQQAHAFGAFTLAAVPEPQSWASMLAGIVLVGALLRRSRRTAPA